MKYEYAMYINGIRHVVTDIVDTDYLIPRPVITEHKTPFFRWVYYQLANLWR